MKKIFLLSLLLFVTLSIYSQSTGCIYGNCTDGYGKFKWSIGDEYIGYWKNGKLNGQGTYIFKSGDKYVGEYLDGKRQGTGTYTWADGQKHSGQWQADKQHGEGTLYNTDATTTIGIWKNGSYEGKAADITGCTHGDCKNGYGTYVWEGGDKYVGNWKVGKIFGQGTYYFASGEKYDGEWKNALRHGYGTNHYVDGTKKTGMWDSDKYIGTGSNNYGCISGDCDNGYGVYTWNTGEKYEGYWVGKKRNGQGTNYYSTGAVCTGEWKGDDKHGYSYYKYKEGSKFKSYRGDFVSNKMTGSGTLLYTNGDKYIGKFDNAYFQGEGTMYYANGTTESGLWEKSIYKGKSNNTQTGCISGNCTNGFGTWLYKNGSKYVGTFKNEQLDGEGTYTASSGDKYIGEFKLNTYHGQGTYFYETGDKYVGEFNNGTYHGIGTMYYANGTNKAGKWENNNFIGKEKTVNPPTISWVTPKYYTSKSDGNQIKAKICVKSESQLENVQFYVNDEIKINYATRGYSVVESNCDFTIERVIPIEEGKNTIKAVVTNNAGAATSELRIVNKEVKSNVVNNQKRLALVIGNGSYPTAALANPPNDASTISAELRKLGFEVMEFTNLSKNDMIRKIRDFGTKLSNEKGVGLFYFAGHGLQLNGENYIVPVTANIEKEQDVELESVNIKRVMGEMDYAKNDLNIVILDACRNNPFARSFRSGGGNGLAETSAPKGTFIAYATSPGSVASDGTGENGLYTQELLKALRKSGLKIEDVFKQVRTNVYQMSGEKQLPWESSSIFGDFYFKK